jgi:hypothetical protein
MEIKEYIKPGNPTLKKGVVGFSSFYFLNGFNLNIKVEVFS